MVWKPIAVCLRFTFDVEQYLEEHNVCLSSFLTVVISYVNISYINMMHMNMIRYFLNNEYFRVGTKRSVLVYSLDHDLVG